MYPPRSRSRQKNKHKSKRKRRTAWAWINAGLLLMITVLLTYSFTNDPDKKSASPPPVAEATATPIPESSDQPQTAPPVVAVATPEATETPSPSPTATPEPTPTPQEEPEEIIETQAPEATATPAKDEDSSESANNDAVSGLPSDDNASGKTVTLNFGGDVIFSGKAGELLEKKGYDYSYAALEGLFKKDDLTILNLETPVTTGGVSATNKQFVFKGSPLALDALKSAGVDAVNMANNHTLDQGEQGLRDTLNHLAERGIPYVGAGLNSKEAYSAQYFERKGIKIALLGFTRVIPASDWMAGKNKPGLASVYDSAEGLKAIAAAKKKADLVVVVVHWGKERVEQYDKTQQSLGHSFIDAGADLVIGGHPHVLQGVEPYKGKWIAYSTGNFIFTRSTVPATWETAVFQAECSVKGQCSLKLKPMKAELAQPVPMNEVDGKLLLKRVEALSAGRVKIGSDGKVTQVTK
ncbi:CapA family protein [Paenibacillus sp. FSL E2-0190]|uniref:CapA family protein n=1 Tax=Paenibacillus sp. FSL E2-0190 TaxID=2954504 RepID=UPI0030EE3F71